VASTSAKAMTFIVGPVSLIALRKTNPDMKRPFFLKMARIIAPIAFIAATLVIYWAGWDVLSLLIPIILGGLVFYFSFVDKDKKYDRATVIRDFKAGYWLIAYFVFILIMSALGSFVPDDWHPIFASADSIPIITAPWDTVVCAI